MGWRRLGPKKNLTSCPGLVDHYTYQCMKNGTDLFHRNVRKILDMCFPGESFDVQMQKTWMTESLLCSAPKESGAVAASAWRACSTCYLKPQINLLPKAVVVALGSKAQTRLKSLDIPFLKAGAAAPPGCNFKGVKESWQEAATELEARRVTSK
jgi:uracil-DNA glycosylase